MELEKKKILEKVRFLREQNGFSQEYMAEEMKITQSKYARFERGSTKTDLDLLFDFCKALNMTFEEFVLYPKKVGVEKNEVMASVVINLKNDKKEKLLELIFGDNNLEVLNQ
ncbi:helix-turn-helix domain-containing protein [Capnocytophaga canis]|uniref:helix-turn-helix domain-containing protein n=1 Tax=Capnocytophaga canis TaxID=1848903 RepID=UPI001561EB05|nr:helix-turn-helix transcriptional regulator [Capnocytophaga canis]